MMWRRIGRVHHATASEAKQSPAGREIASVAVRSKASPLLRNDRLRGLRAFAGNFVFLALLLSACQAVAPAASTPTAVPVVAGETALSVEGKLMPVRDASLAFNLGGTIGEVLVAEGQQVQAGEVLARLEQTERLASAVAAAELELVNARQGRQALLDNAEVRTAAAQQAVAAARDALRDAERYLNNLVSGGKQTNIDQASANLVLLKDRLDEAQKDFNQYARRPEDDLTRATYQSRLAEVQQQYDNAVRLLNNLEGPATGLDLDIATANLALAQAQLAFKEQEYQDVQSGPDPQDMELAEARLAATEAALAAAQAALDDAELRAPFSGTIVRLDVKAGETAVPGLPAVVLADMSTWKVETTDLNEMDLSRVEVGMQVVVNPDALPELSLAGRLDEISQYAVERFGDVTYTATIQMLETDPRLRWGMTVQVVIE
jgi:multidrug resistance efflux pump